MKLQVAVFWFLGWNCYSTPHPTLIRSLQKSSQNMSWEHIGTSHGPPSQCKEFIYRISTWPRSYMAKSTLCLYKNCCDAGCISPSFLLFLKRTSSVLHSILSPAEKRVQTTRTWSTYWGGRRQKCFENFPSTFNMIFLFTSTLHTSPATTPCPTKPLSSGPAAKALTRVVGLHDGHDKGVRKEHGCTLPHALKLHGVSLEHDPMHISLCAQAEQVPGHYVTLAHVQPGQVREQKSINGWKTKTQDRIERWDQTTWAPTSSMASALYCGFPQLEIPKSSSTPMPFPLSHISSTYEDLSLWDESPAGLSGLTSPPLASIAPHFPGFLTTSLIVPRPSCSHSPSLHKVLGFPRFHIQLSICLLFIFTETAMVLALIISGLNSCKVLLPSTSSWSLSSHSLLHKYTHHYPASSICLCILKALNTVVA